MAIRKQRLCKQLDDGTLDTIWLETSADIVKFVKSDGTTGSMVDAMEDMRDDVADKLKVVNQTIITNNATLTDRINTVETQTTEKIESVRTEVQETKTTVQETVEKLTTVQEVVVKIQEVVLPPEIPDNPEPPKPVDPGKEPGGDDIDDHPTNDGTINGYKPGESVDMVPSVGEGQTGSFTGYYYFVFERADFVKDGSVYKVKLPQTYHKMEPKQTICINRLRTRVGRTAVDYHRDTQLSAIREALILCQRTALNRYMAGEHDNFPMDEDGNVILTWEQVQVWLLEETMKTRSEARDYCLNKGINWKNIQTIDVTTEVTIEDLMSACYIPAATPGASTALIDRILSYDVIHALHLRHRDVDVAIQSKYDLFGKMYTNVWADHDTQVYWDLRTKELVIEATAPYPGDILVVG